MYKYIKSKKKYLNINVKRTFTCPDYTIKYKEICDELKTISIKLQKLLPDPSIGPEERIERLARVIPKSMLISNYHKTARAKLHYIHKRLSQLVPDKKKINNYRR